MKKVIALNENEDRILTTNETAEKNNLWITHNLNVEILPKDYDNSLCSQEPDKGNTFLAPNNRAYKIISSEKVLVCSICQSKANFRIEKRFYCKKHYKHLVLTRPIRRELILPNRNDICSCGSGKKFKNCCIKQYQHTPRHYFNSRYMENKSFVKSQSL